MKYYYFLLIISCIQADQTYNIIPFSTPTLRDMIAKPLDFAGNTESEELTERDTGLKKKVFSLEDNEIHPFATSKLELMLNSNNMIFSEIALYITMMKEAKAPMCTATQQRLLQAVDQKEKSIKDGIVGKYENFIAMHDAFQRHNDSVMQVIVAIQSYSLYTQKKTSLCQNRRQTDV